MKHTGVHELDAAHLPQTVREIVSGTKAPASRMKHTGVNELAAAHLPQTVREIFGNESADFKIEALRR